MNLKELVFDNKGLIPCVVQDFYTKKVLMLAYMNRDSLDITLDKKRLCFYSRSHNGLWLKGETSGNYLNLVKLSADCDMDSLLAEVMPEGPACHTGEISCFFNRIQCEQVDAFTLQALYELIKERKAKMPEGSYTTYLFEKGKEKILKKVGEEATEVIIGATKGSNAETIYEISDLAYHILVLMIEMGITVNDILSELESRHIIDKKTKQETMK